ncbi:cell division protein [Bacillus sp. AFS015802]|uniref:cell division FtsA domain-containing protein n=1 Tax=Bacillus sp. AFS015802 TaxID=2033486 RepID=UPI000BF7DE2A|nr:cell division FtsA domain-containing protein [Bacillus sp. AFS015802]PFA69664.1 cell division protein [Bacillus sp. AFS015802]
MKKTQKIFALDIGTRSVVGLILEEIDGIFQVSDILMEEHKKRAMLDGQIHDVPAVAEVISSIKGKLETKHGPLYKVCVAAAGRALKTETSLSTLNIKGKPLLQKNDILHLELSAVQQAQALAAENEQNAKGYHYYCVGYSVLFYRLDGEEIGSLVDQQGDEASVEIIATFLPRVVVESLIAALTRAGLEMEALTLEPIAAINVLIPESMRRLNVALVDIGAGTSDIAITNMGTVIAYGMVPTAGDEITEAISNELLLDFPLAEKAKRELQSSGEITVTDILGFETIFPSLEVVEKIAPAVNRLAGEISKEILRLNNGKPPQAVMLVGGGSLTPGLPVQLASSLQLPPNRVAVRGVDAIQNVTLSEEVTKGPELVTPIGIAIAAKQAPVQYVTAYVNDQPVRLFEVKDLTIGDCILAAGLKVSKWHGTPGNGFFVSVNGQDITLPGGHGQPPLIEKNGQPCELDETIQNHDRITVQKGKNGSSPQVTIGDLVDTSSSKQIEIDGNRYQLTPLVYRNNQPVPLEEVIHDRDEIRIVLVDTLLDVLTQFGYTEWLEAAKPYRISINGVDTFFPAYCGRLFIHDVEAKPSAKIKNGDVISFKPGGTPTVKDILMKKKFTPDSAIRITFNGEEVYLKKESSRITRNGVKLGMDDRLVTGDSIHIEEQPMSSFIFQDLFNSVEINMPAHSNGSFVLLKNGEETTFFEEIQEGDELEIVWPQASR